MTSGENKINMTLVLSLTQSEEVQYFPIELDD